MTILRTLSFASISLIAAFAACGDDEEGTSSPAGTASVTTAVGTGGATASSSSSSGTGGCGQTTQLNVPCTQSATTANQTACEVLNQTCPPGQWCDVSGTETVCKPDTGGVKCKGQDCAFDSDCRAGLKCVFNKCSPFCCPDATGAGKNQPCDGGLCNVDVPFGGGVIGRLCSYPPQCELLADSCPAGTNCYVLDDAQALAGCYSPSDMVPHGGECDNLNDCEESSHCFDDDMDASTPLVCRQLCDVQNWMNEEPPTGGCPPGNSCTPVTWQNSQWTAIGVCLPGGGAGGAGGAGGN